MMHVHVVSGDGETPLGDGTLTGYVAVHFFRMPNGSLCSMDDAALKPSAEFLAEMEKCGGEHIVLSHNPRIELDSGRVVYGCQVWWTPFTEEEEA